MEDYSRIKVGAHLIGIMGLKEVLAEMAEHHSDASDEQIARLMREKLAAMNYLAKDAERIYEQAFLREFKKFIGQAVPAEAANGLTIKVLGQGCPQCERLKAELMQILTENKLAADLEHVTDPMEIAAYGLFATPVLIINDRIRSTGTIPSRGKLKAWLIDESA